MCPKDAQAVAVFLPGLAMTMLLASWPHISLLSGGGAMGGAYTPDSGQGIGRVLLEDRKPVIDVHVSVIDSLARFQWQIPGLGGRVAKIFWSAFFDYKGEEYWRGKKQMEWSNNFKCVFEGDSD